MKKIIALLTGTTIIMTVFYLLEKGDREELEAENRHLRENVHDLNLKIELDRAEKLMKD